MQMRNTIIKVKQWLFSDNSFYCLTVYQNNDKPLIRVLQKDLGIAYDHYY